MDEKAKKQALLMIPYGLFVLGAAHGGTSTAATVNWVTQASFNPPLVVVGIKNDSGSHAMVKDSKKYAATGGWGYSSFDKDGKPSPASAMKMCFPCHQAVSDRDFIFTRYAP